MNNRCFLLVTVLTAIPLLASITAAQPVAQQEEPPTNTVYVMGEVLKPGAYKAQKTSTISDLLALAGTTQLAGLDEIKVHHQGTNFTIDLPRLEAETAQGKETLFVLDDGDTIIVPPATKWVYIAGSVARPGKYLLPLQGKFSAAEALALAGDARTGNFAVRFQLLRPSASGKSSSSIVQDETLLHTHDTLVIGDAPRPKARLMPVAK